MNDIPKSSARVLVVDDNEVNRIILLNMLEVFDIHADEAEDGEKAVLMAVNNPYDLILVDHIMPGMNGLRTTAELRRQALNKEQAIIIALTADVDEAIKERYRNVQANDVWAKPIELKDLSTILRNWNLLERSENQVRSIVTDELTAGDEYMQKILNTIEDIDYEAGMKFALGNSAHYAEILSVSQKDLRSCIQMIIHGHDSSSVDEFKMGVHKLKNILSNIGALQLYEKASVFERVLKDLSQIDTEYMYRALLSGLKNFEDKLSSALELIRATRAELTGIQGSPEKQMSAAEYEQSLLNAIYYIRRYEYESIVLELKNLILRGKPEDRAELVLALEDIRGFDYDAALSRIVRAKK